jgi:hypothetical protein
MIQGLVLLSVIQGAGAGTFDASVDYTAPAPGQEGAFRQAEYRRLTDRLRYLWKKNNVNATRKIYTELEALGMPLTYTDLIIGAQLFRSEGNIAEAYLRLTQAARLTGTREVIDWLVAIDSEYGQVVLRVEKDFQKGLSAEQAIILPDKKAALNYANSELSKNLIFEGFLPRGSYTVAKHSFEVRAGLSPLELNIGASD